MDRICYLLFWPKINLFEYLHIIFFMISAKNVIHPNQRPVLSLNGSLWEVKGHYGEYEKNPGWDEPFFEFHLIKLISWQKWPGKDT